jgi:hypothetical protein
VAASRLMRLLKRLMRLRGRQEIAELMRQDMREAEQRREQILRRAGPCQCGVCRFQRGEALNERQRSELLHFVLDYFYRYFVYVAREAGEGGRVGGAAWRPSAAAWQRLRRWLSAAA